MKDFGFIKEKLNMAKEPSGPEEEKGGPERMPAGKNRIIATVASVLVVLLLLVSVVMPDRDFSDRENRVLMKFPHFSLSAVTDGSFMSSFETYVTDQFPLRDAWISMRTAFRSTAGIYDSNGVFRGDDGYLFEDAERPDRKVLNDRMYVINTFAANSGIPVYMLIAPNASDILTEELPRFAPLRNQDEDLDMLYSMIGEGVTNVDVRQAIRAADEMGTQVYYRTDHHWTTRGAGCAFAQFASQAGLNVSAFARTYLPVTDSFSGTLSAKSGFDVKNDTIHIITDDSGVEYVVEYKDEQDAHKTACLYESDKLDTGDKYALFFGGNHSEVDIETTAYSNRRVLVIKDSYANCFVPFMLPYYSDIIMVDPRYYTGDIYSLIRENGITEVLFLYNANTFFEDNFITGILNTAG